MTESRRIFQAIAPGFEDLVRKEAGPGEARPVRAEVLAGLQVEAAQRERYAVERAARGRVRLVKDTLVPAGTDTRFDPRLDPAGLEGRGGGKETGMRERQTSPSEIERFLYCPGCASEGGGRGKYTDETAAGVFIHEVVEGAVGWKRTSTRSTVAQLRSSRQGRDRALHEFVVRSGEPALVSRADGARRAFLEFMEEKDLNPVGGQEGEYTIRFDGGVKLVGRYDIKLDAGRRKYVVDIKTVADLQSLGDNFQMAVAMLGLGRTPVLFDVSSYAAYVGRWSEKRLRLQIERIVRGVTELKGHRYSVHWCGRGDVSSGLFATMEVVTGQSPLDQLANGLRSAGLEIVAESGWQSIWSGGERV